MVGRFAGSVVDCLFVEVLTVVFGPRPIPMNGLHRHFDEVVNWVVRGYIVKEYQLLRHALPSTQRGQSSGCASGASIRRS